MKGHKLKQQLRKGQAKYKKTMKGKVTEHKYKISEKNKKYNREYRKKNKNHAKTNMILCNTIKSGKLKRGKCVVCNNKNALGHHPDYNKPLDVIWLCPKHHSELHNKIYWR